MYNGNMRKKTALVKCKITKIFMAKWKALAGLSYIFTNNWLNRAILKTLNFELSQTNRRQMNFCY
jgi:hypothetical protein